MNYERPSRGMSTEETVLRKPLDHCQALFSHTQKLSLKIKISPAPIFLADIVPPNYPRVATASTGTNPFYNL